jgi:cold shock CspA family protein
MRLPIQIAFHNMPHDDAIESSIYGNAEWLDNFYDRIMSCRVVVDLPHLHHQEGNRYEIRIDLKVPGRELAVKRDGEFKDVDSIIRDAFDDARRQLEDYARRQRGHVKSREPRDHARVARLFPDSGYGFLETQDGREIYFHRNSVVEASYDDLAVGTEVRFVEELGEKGPQASTLVPVGRHSHA